MEAEASCSYFSLAEEKSIHFTYSRALAAVSLDEPQARESCFDGVLAKVHSAPKRTERPRGASTTDMQAREPQPQVRGQAHTFLACRMRERLRSSELAVVSVSPSPKPKEKDGEGEQVVTSARWPGMASVCIGGTRQDSR